MEADVVPVNAILLAEAHVAKSGEVKEKYNSACNMFCVSHCVKKKL